MHVTAADGGGGYTSAAQLMSARARVFTQMSKDRILFFSFAHLRTMATRTKKVVARKTSDSSQVSHCCVDRDESPRRGQRTGEESDAAGTMIVERARQQIYYVWQWPLCSVNGT